MLPGHTVSGSLAVHDFIASARVDRWRLETCLRTVANFTASLIAGLYHNAETSLSVRDGWIRRQKPSSARQKQQHIISVLDAFIKRRCYRIPDYRSIRRSLRITSLAGGFDDLREAARIEIAPPTSARRCPVASSIASVLRFHAARRIESDPIGHRFIRDLAQRLRMNACASCACWASHSAGPIAQIGS